MLWYSDNQAVNRCKLLGRAVGYLDHPVGEMAVGLGGSRLPMVPSRAVQFDVQDIKHAGRVLIVVIP